MISLILAKLGITGAVVAVLIDAVSIYAAVICIENARLVDQLDQSRRGTGRLNVAPEAERAASDKQQRGVQALEAENIYLAARIKIAASQIDSLSKKSDAERHRIRAASIPKNCDGTVSWLATEAPGIAAKWNAARR